MSIIDPIADMFTRIRNAGAEKHSNVRLSHSTIKANICRILKDEGFIQDFSISDESLFRKNLIIKLKYTDTGNTIIRVIKRISKSSKRMYVKKSDIPKVLNGFGICILSTSKGILSGREARISNVGGELIGEVH